MKSSTSAAPKKFPSNDLALLVKQRTSSTSPITHIPYDQAYEPGFEDMPRRVPALEKLGGLTGFRPSTSLNEIVDCVIAYFHDKAGSRHGQERDRRRCGRSRCRRIIRGLIFR